MQRRPLTQVRSRRGASCVQQRRQHTGFTLVELITVMVVLSVLATMGSRFVVSSVSGFYQTQERSKLVGRGRQAIEQMSRQLRDALPNSVRVSANANCIEFLPVVGGGQYLGVVPDLVNGATANATLSTSPVTLGAGNAEYVAVGALAPSELYSSSPASLAALSSVDTAAVPNTAILNGNKQWLRNSPTRRLFLVAKPRQFCVFNNRLTQHRDYTSGTYPSSTALADTPPNAGDLMASNVSVSNENPFAISQATESRNAVISIVLPLTSGTGERVVLRHQVMVRNVP